MVSTEEPQKPPPVDQEEYVTELIGLAYNQVEGMLREGKATSQIVMHFLEIDSKKHEIDILKKQQELKLLEAKTKSEEDQVSLVDMMKRVEDAMTGYRGDQYED